MASARLCLALLSLPTIAAAQGPDPWRPRTVPLYGARYSPDLGLVLGAGVSHTRYAFRALPPSTQLALRVAYATRMRTGQAGLTAEFRKPLAPATLGFELHASGLEMVRFYGAGSETDGSAPDSVYRIEQTQLGAAATVSVQVAPRARIAVGPVFRHTRTRAGAATLFATTGPHFGSGDFGQVGAGITLDIDTRDAPVAAAHGARVRVAAEGYSFAKVSAEASAFLSSYDPARVTLALRAGAATTFGRVPFQQLVYIGGEGTVRGYPEQRFAGRRGAYGNIELRLRLLRDIGIFGLADAGRVWVPGETSDRWHAAAGGGLWFAPGGRRSDTISLAIARSPERTSLYFRAGFLF